MFIVTRGAGNYKLGAVSVAAVSEGEFKQSIAQKRSELKPLVDKVIQKELECENTGVLSTAQLLHTLCEAQAAVLRFDIGESYFAAMPKPVAVATTDSDGKFRLTLPSSGKFIIVAKASRAAGRTSEAYLWLVPIDAVGGEQTVSLSSNNLWNPSQSGL